MEKTKCWRFSEDTFWYLHGIMEEEECGFFFTPSRLQVGVTTNYILFTIGL